MKQEDIDKYIEKKGGKLSEMSRFFCIDGDSKVAISPNKAKDFIRTIVDDFLTDQG